jgi:hypothetical protein
MARIRVGVLVVLIAAASSTGCGVFCHFNGSCKGDVTCENGATPTGPDGTCQSPPPKSVQSITVSGTAPVVGATAPFTATAHYSDNSTSAVTGSATWQSSSQAIATVNAQGVVTGVSAGDVDISASLSGVSGKTRVSITRTFTVSGTVSDATSKAGVSGATVQIKDGPSAGKSATTSTSGAYTLSGVTAGTMTIAVSLSSYEPASRSVTVNADVRVDIGLTKSPPNKGPAFIGCYAAGASYNQIGCGITNTLVGDPSIDAAFMSEISYQASFWGGVPATVYPFNECSPQSKNAMSFPGGIIVFGQYLAYDLLSQYWNGLPISGVLAHEWAHQVQFNNGWQNRGTGTARPTELEADAFSGFYMGLAKQFAWNQIDSYFAAVAGLGDYNFNHPQHHGTPQERLAAARLGFDTAINSLQTGRRYTYQDLHFVFVSAIGSSVMRTSLASRGDIGAPSADAEALLRELNVDQVRAIASGASRGTNVVPRESGTPKEALFPRK